MTNLKPAGPPIPAQDLSAYQTVVITLTAEVGGHTYRRGQRATVDAATFAALRDKNMVGQDTVSHAKPAG